MKIVNDKTELNWGMIILLLTNAFFWVSVWLWGFFISITWTIVLSCIIGLWYKLTGRI